VIPKDLTPALLEGDVREALRRLPDETIHCVVTSPPYWGLRDYGIPPVRWGGKASCPHQWEGVPPRRKRSPEDVRNPGSIQAGHVGANITLPVTQNCSRCGGWLGQLGLEPDPDLFVDHLASVFDEVRRVLRSDGSLWLNLGDTFHTDSPVRRSSGEAFSSKWDPSQTRSRGGNRRSAGKFGELKPKDLTGIPWRVAFELRRRGWWLRSDCIWAKRNPMPEPVRDRPTRSHEYVFLLTKSRRYFYDAEAVREPLQESSMRRLRNHLPNATDNPAYRSKHPEGDFRRFPMLANTDPSSGRNLRSVWRIATQPYPGAHFATFPEALPEICIRAGTSERGACAECGTPWARKVRAEGGGIGHDWHPVKSLAFGRGQGIAAPGIHDGTYRRIDLGFRKRCRCPTERIVPCLVLDPFTGSGTVLAVARRLGRRSVGIDLNPEYVVLARQRSSVEVPVLAEVEEASA
jgi:DNA modification methylase